MATSDDFNIIKKELDNITKDKRYDIMGITIHCYGKWYDLTAQYGGYERVNNINLETPDYGFNYAFDEYDTVQEIDPNFVADPFLKNKLTYIAQNKFMNEPIKTTISVCIFIDANHDYEVTEKRLIRFLAYLLNKYKLTPNDIWRGFDLSKEDLSPLHYLDKDIFSKLLDQVTACYASEYSDDSQTDSDSSNDNIENKIYEYESPFKDKLSEGQTVDQYIKDFYNRYRNNPEEYAKDFEPWDKSDKDAITDNKNAKVDVKTKIYKTKNTLQYSVKEVVNPLPHCYKPYDFMDGMESTEKTYVEPIYPDLISPPGASITIADGESKAAIVNDSNTPITVEEFEKRQKTFSLNDFSNVKKETKGRPINTDEPYPVDEQIQKLEEHYPKVKIDKTKYSFAEDNHPGSELGPIAMANFNMCYDMINEVSKRTEQRLVKIENILSTVTRNAFRMSSRVNINCVYYGGQSVYSGKYKCIRCLRDNRIDDGAVVSMDQCLCCTRYEPIIGQVYAILDEAGSNVSQVVDDLQMSYQTIEEYNTLNNVNKYASSPKKADLLNDSYKVPKAFRDTLWADTDSEMIKKRQEREKVSIASAEIIAESGGIFDTFSKNGIVSEEEKQISQEKTNNVLNKRNEKISFQYEDFKDYLDPKLQNVVILDKHNIQMTIEEYLVQNKYDILSELIPQLENESDSKEYKDENGNKISKDDYISLVKKKFRESYVNDIYFNGFKMDWVPTQLETQKPIINEYTVEKIQNGNVAYKSDVETRREIFKNNKTSADKYEQIEFNIEDYMLSGFGSSSGSGSTSGNGTFNLSGSEARNKILEYAKHAVDLCSAGKAWYSMPERLSHDGKTGSGGKEYWDCSSLAGWCYQKAGFSSISESDTTYTEYPQCKSGANGKLIPIANESEAIPGDLIFFSHSPGSDIENVVVNTIHHVAIYKGNGMMYEAKGSNYGIVESPISGRDAFAFGRPSDLIEADSKASSSSSNLIEFTKSWEGFVSTWDHSSKYGAIGYGTDASGDVGSRLKKQGVTSCTKEEATEWLKEELDAWAEQIKKKAGGANLSQYALDCMTDICYQWGNQQWGILKLLCSGDIDGAKSKIRSLGYARRDNARCDILDGHYTLNP